MSLVGTHWPGEPGLASEEGVATQGGLSSRNERKRRRRVVGGLGRCGRKWVEKNGLKRRVCAMSLLLWLALECVLLGAAVGHRPLKDTRVLEFDNSLWLNERLFTEGDGGPAVGPYSMLNITGIYKGTWDLHNGNNLSGQIPTLEKMSGNLIFELMSLATEIHGIHYVKGVVVMRNGLYLSDGDLKMKIEGIYVWPLRQLHMVLTSAMDSNINREDFIQSSPYQLLDMFSSQVFQDSPQDYTRPLKKSSSIAELGRICKIQLVAQVSTMSSEHKHEHSPAAEHEQQTFEIQGLMEAPMIDNEEGVCFSQLIVNATSVNVGVYFNKAVNYTLMITFISFLQALFLIQQMERSNTQLGAMKVSLLMIGQQAIMDAYLCLLHLTAGILVESLFNAFAMAAFFKFVIFSMLEMRYLLAIWKAQRPAASGEGWETMRRELSVLYSRLLGNLVWDTRKPLHPQYIVGITVTHLAIPLYIFGCPNNFMGVETNIGWCIGLTIFLALQATILLLQHYFGARCFIPHQMLPEKYSYFRKVEKSSTTIVGADESVVVDCVICMVSVDMAQWSTESMVTPCDHFFHAGCLQRWMDIKMECPTCRRQLPPM
ncbi:unnamed protein product [Sphagnum troendelagicum]|uniref:RING-type E3 ubiquitin transferase n=1 Tax=Sphagnum troendelagicum TaxID=128251 RepID=A0ABP0TEV5_9BRYO